MAKFVPLIAAIVTGAVLLFGYIYESEKKREFEITQKQQEIYTRLIENLITKDEYFDQLRDDPQFAERVTSENVAQFYAIIDEDYPDLKAAMDETREIMALLALYGTDEAIEAVANYYESGIASMEPESRVAPNAGQLIADLRRSLFPGTQVEAYNINLIMSD